MQHIMLVEWLGRGLFAYAGARVFGFQTSLRTRAATSRQLDSTVAASVARFFCVFVCGISKSVRFLVVSAVGLVCDFGFLNGGTRM